MPITHNRLLEQVSYDPDTGIFVWKAKRVGVSVGARAGCPRKSGRRVIRIDYVCYEAARLAWFYMTGEWPSHDIDHEDRDPGNDKWGNLRAATDAQQTWNIGLRKNNTSGYIGIRKTISNKWRAAIRVGGDHREWLGTFLTPEQAASAYNTRAAQLRGEFAVLND